MPATPPTREELEAAHCWEPTADRVPGRPAMTEFRRAARLQAARWREARGHPVGTEPLSPKPGGRSRLVGSRIPFDYARETGANFVTDGARAAATERTSRAEPHQTFDTRRLWADLLWSTPFACNLFGDLAADHDLATRAVRTWWPEVPGTVVDVRFLHSPGRLDPQFLGTMIWFHTAFVLDLEDGTEGVVGVETRYHDRTKREIPKPERLGRYREVAERSGAFRDGAPDLAEGSDLVEMWLGHLLALSMPQHPSGRWSWARYVLVHPAGNVDYADACARYRTMLTDESTYASSTLEDLLDAGALPKPLTTALRDRYLY